MALTSTAVRTVALPSGELVPALGQGSWGMGENRRHRSDEIAALRRGLDLGMTLIDTAEMYGGGGAEEVVGEAISGRRNEVFLVSKVLPSHATRRQTVAACRASLARLRVELLDLYLLHWRGEVPLDETLEAFRELTRSGAIRYWGVSNFAVPDMEDLVQLEGGRAVATDQVLYNLSRRGIEYDLLPWCRKRKIPIMAYSPIDRGRLTKSAAVKRIAVREDATPSQIALAWVLRHPDAIAIPKGATLEHVRENRGALEIRLSEEDLRALDRAFPPPTKKAPLEIY